MTRDRVWIGNWLYWTHIQNVTAGNYNRFINFRTLQFTTTRTESSQSAVSSPVVA
jgi:hypothetical protein